MFRADNVYDTLTLVAQTEIGQSKLLDVVFESNALRAGIRFFDKLPYIFEILARGGRHILERSSTR